MLIRNILKPTDRPYCIGLREVLDIGDRECRIVQTIDSQFFHKAFIDLGTVQIEQDCNVAEKRLGPLPL